MSEPRVVFMPVSEAPGLSNEELERWADGFEEAIERFLEERAGRVTGPQWDAAEAWWSVKAELGRDEWEVALVLPSGFAGLYHVTRAGSVLLEGRLGE